MADKENKIKIIFDLDVAGVVEGGAKARAVFDDQAKLIEQVRIASAANSHVQQMYNHIVEEQTIAMKGLSSIIERINNDPRIDDTLALHMAEAAVVKYNNTLTTTETKLHSILDLVNRVQAPQLTTTTPSVPTNTPPPTFAPTGGGSTAWVQADALTRFEQKHKEVMAKITLMEQVEAEKRISIEGAEQAKRAAYVDAFMRHFENAEAKRTQITLSSAKADSRGYTPMASGTVAGNRAVADTKVAQDFNLVNRQLEITNAKRLAQEELYANYALKQKEALNSRILQIEKDKSAQEEALRSADLNKLRADIQIRSALESERVAREIQVESDRAGFAKAQREQELSSLRADITARSNAAQETIGQNLSVFNSNQEKQQAALQQSINRQVAIEKYGADSIQVTRLDAANKITSLQQNLANSIETIQRRVSNGSINAQQATAGLAKIHESYKAAILQSTAALNQQESVHIQSAHTQKNLFVRIGEIIGIYRAYILVLEGVKRAAMSVPQSGIALEATIASLTATFGNISGAQKELVFLRNEADRTGISIKVLRDSYQQASASFIASGESADTTRKIFQNINTVSATLHLSADKTSSIYLALSQVFNKTKLQAEELTKQLSQVIPGVTAAQAEALQITVAELYDEMKKGSVSAHDSMIKLSEVLADTYGGDAFKRATSGLNASLGRLNTAWTVLSETVYKSSADMIVSVINFATGSANALTAAGTNTYDLALGFKKLVGEAAGLAAGYAAAHIAIKLYSTYTKLAALDTEVLQGKLISLGATLKSGLFVAAIAELGMLIGKTAAFRAELDNLNKKAAEIEAGRTASKGTPAQQRQYTIDTDENVKRAEAEADVARKTYERYSKGFFKASAEDIQTAYHTYNVLTEEVIKTRNKVSKELAESAKKTQEHIVPQKVDASDAIARAEADFLKSTGDKVGAARKAFLNSNQKDIDTLMQAYAQGDAKAGEALGKLQSAYLTQGIEDKTKGGGGAAQAAAQDNYRDLIRDSKLYTKQITEQVKELDQLYKYQAISIEEYYARKQSLEEQDIQRQIDNAAKIQALAAARKDVGKVEEMEDVIQGLTDKIATSRQETDRQKFDDLKKFETILAQVNAEYARLTGGLEGISSANVREVNEEYKERINIIQAQIKAGQVQWQGELDKAQVIVDQTASLKTINDYQGKIKKMLDVIAASEEKIDRDRKAGITTTGDAAKNLSNIRDQYYDTILKSVQAIDAEAAANKGNLDIELARLEAHAQLARLNTNAAGDYLSSVAASSDDPASKIQNVWKTSQDRETQFEQEKNNKLKEINATYYADKALQAADAAKVEETYSSASLANSFGMYSGMFSVGSETFKGLAEESAKMYGAQSKQAKQAFMLYKATKMAETVAATAQAVVVALGAGPYIGIALAAVAAAMGAFQIAKIAALQPPAAHGGMDYIPKEQTYLLDKGERVISPRQNRDLTSFINNSTINNNQSGSSLRIINVQDTGMVRDYLGSTEGEDVVVNIMRRNREDA